MARRPRRTWDGLLAALDAQGPSFEGLIRQARSNSEVEFSLGLTGADWIPIAIADLDDLAALGRYAVKGETYRVVRLRLKAPTGGRALVFARLAGAPLAPLSVETLLTAAAGGPVAGVLSSTGWCRDYETGEWYKCPPYRDA